MSKLLQKIRLTHLKEWSACYWYPCCWEDDDEESAILAARCEAELLPATPMQIAECKWLSVKDRVWVLLRKEIIPEERLHELVCDFAESVLHIYEDKYPNDRHLRNAIETKRKYLKGEITDKEFDEVVVKARRGVFDARKTTALPFPSSLQASFAARATLLAFIVLTTSTGRVACAPSIGDLGEKVKQLAMIIKVLKSI